MFQSVIVFKKQGNTPSAGEMNVVAASSRDNDQPVLAALEQQACSPHGYTKAAGVRTEVGSEQLRMSNYAFQPRGRAKAGRDPREF